MTVVDDVEAKEAEIAGKITFVKTMGGKATDSLWVDGDGGYAALKSICDVQSNLLTTLAAELETLVT
ncbi:hypothetical protein LCGC14_2396530 [marine sediment metagenome]|uniref:Uncharacterized protein n=1 Tax=marine sediment metagenome TaxID=412755 RepID=A0A0F9CIQ5_9ZZZZ